MCLLASLFHHIDVRPACHIDWDAAYTRLRETLGLPLDDDIPKMVRKPPAPILPGSDNDNPPPPSDAKPTAGKRKAEEEADGAAKESATAADGPKPTKTKKTKGKTTSAPPPPPPPVVPDMEVERATMTPNINLAFIPFLTPADLAPPKLPTKAEMEEVLLAVRKKALLEEFIG